LRCDARDEVVEIGVASPLVGVGMRDLDHLPYAGEATDMAIGLDRRSAVRSSRRPCWRSMYDHRCLSSTYPLDHSQAVLHV
jgi:hypothetical protein